MKFMAGDRVRWGYAHCLGRNYTWIEKEGTLIGPVKHRRSYMNQLPLRQPMARVHFDGNKKPSTVPFPDIQFIRPGSLFPDKECAGEKYRPASGTDGSIFEERWCGRCKKDEAVRLREDYDNGCPILADMLAYYSSDPEYPKELIYDTNGQPTCTAFEVDKGADG